MRYNDITYSTKISRLLEKQTSVQLAERLGVSRMSLVNWRNDDSGIKPVNRLNIDIEFVRTFGFDHITDAAVEEQITKLREVGLANYSPEEDALLDQLVNANAFGSLEVEESWATREKYDMAIKGEELSKITKHQFLSAHNLAILTKKVFTEAFNNNLSLDKNRIMEWHFILMSGIRDDAGRFSTRHRVIPGADDITLTEPQDIEEEVSYWCNKYQKVKSIEEIAEAHAHFELIHPFGDGNGRIGRLIMAAQSISIGTIPASINNSNKALYYVYLHHAQTTGNAKPLTWLLADLALGQTNKGTQQQ